MTSDTVTTRDWTCLAVLFTIGGVMNGIIIQFKNFKVSTRKFLSNPNGSLSVLRQ
jgi:hypothetical protein